MTEHEASLAAQLGGFRRRIRRLLVERWVCRALAGAGLIALALIVVDACTLWYITPAWLIALALLGSAAGLLRAWRTPLPDLAVAVTVERRHPLQERVSTAVALRDDTAAQDPEFRALVTADAVAHLTGLPPKALFPWRVARHHLAALAIWVLALGLFLLPGLGWGQSPRVAAERAAMAESGQALQALADQLDTTPETRQNPAARELARRMKQLGVEMQYNRIPRKEALKRMHQLQEELEQVAPQLAQQQQQRAAQEMATASTAVQQALQQRPEADKQRAERARQQLAGGVPPEQLAPAERQALARERRLDALQQRLQAGDRAGAKDQLRQMGRELQGEQMSDEERRRLGEMLQGLAEQMPSLSEADRQALAEAAQRLAQGSPEDQQQAAQALANLPPEVQQDLLAAARQGLAQARRGVADNRPTTAQGTPAGEPGQAEATEQGASGRTPAPGSTPGGEETPSAAGATPVSGPGRDTTPSGKGAGARGEARPPLPAGLQAQQEHAAIDQRGRAVMLDVPPELGGAGATARTSVPYQQVYTQYQRSAEHALTQEHISAANRQRVKAYYDRLNPGP